MIIDDRDPRFWRDVAQHPDVAPYIMLGHEFDIGALVEHTGIRPLRSENGGFLFVRLDGLARVWELHTLYKPEGWGKEVARALKEALQAIFEAGGQIITTYDVEGWWRSCPPKSYGFVPAGEHIVVPHLDAALRTWVLTRAAWEESPACRRLTKCH